MSNLIYNTELKLPAYEKIIHRNGDVVGIKVKRSSYTVHYHRTDRTATEVFDATSSGMQKLFLSADGFARFAKRQRVLDLGCGGGSLVRDLTRFSVSILGLDLYLTDPQLRSPLFIQGDAFQMPFRNESFDILLACWSVFHYEPISQMGTLLKEVKRVLSPNGSLWIPALYDMERLYQLKVCCKRLGMTPNIHLPSGVIECTKR